MNPAEVYLMGLMPTGRYTMMRTLDRLAALLGSSWQDFAWHELRYEHVQALRAKLAETQAPATVNTALCAIRGVLRAAWRMGQMDTDAYLRTVDVSAVSGEALLSGRAINAAELGSVLRACVEDDSPAGARDAAIIVIGYAGGLRRAEIVGLDAADVQDDGETLAITVRHGKRNKERVVYLQGGAAHMVRDWLAVRGSRPGPLFMPGYKGGRLGPMRHMTGQAIHDIIAKRAGQAGVEDVTPLDLRRSFISDLLDDGVDICTIADLAGHEDINTTARYDRRGESRKMRAARRLTVPRP